MARRRRDRGEDAKKSEGPSRQKAGPDSVAVQAVRTTGGRAATTVHVELDPDKMPGVDDARDVEEVVAQFPHTGGAPSQGGPQGEISWEDQSLQKSGDVEGESGKRVRYSTTRYEVSDADQYGIRVHVRTKGGSELDTDPCGHVRDADKPDG